MVGLQAAIQQSGQLQIISSHSKARLATAVSSAATTPTAGNGLVNQQLGAYMRHSAKKQLPAVRGSAVRCQSSLTPDRPLGVVPADRSASDSSSYIFRINSWFDLPQVSPSLRQPLSISTPAAVAVAEPPALECSSGAATPHESQAPENAVTRIFEPEQLTEFLEAHKQQLVVLMCKAHSCRPCKMFMRRYARIAQQYAERGVCFLEIFGDDTKETRQLMMAMEIRVTPNFRFYRDGRLVHSLTGINETNLRNAVEEY